jgi:hypothetical protein
VATTALAVLGVGGVVAAQEDPPEDKVCAGDQISGGNQTSITITAPEGQLIASVCIKAGSAEQGDGPETITYSPPVKSVTITHSTGKEISHYVVTYVPVTTTTQPPPDDDDDGTTTTTQPDDDDNGTTTTQPDDDDDGTTTTQPVVTPTTQPRTPTATTQPSVAPAPTVAPAPSGLPTTL